MKKLMVLGTAVIMRHDDRLAVLDSLLTAGTQLESLFNYTGLVVAIYRRF